MNLIRTSDVRVVDPRLDNDCTDGVHRHNSVRALRCDALNEGVPIVPEEQVVPVACVPSIQETKPSTKLRRRTMIRNDALNGNVTFTRVGVDEDEAGVRVRRDAVDRGVIGVGEHRLDDNAVLVRTDIVHDRCGRIDEVREIYPSS